MIKKMKINKIHRNKKILKANWSYKMNNLNDSNKKI